MRAAFLLVYQKLYFDKSIHTRAYQVDDQVLLFNLVKWEGHSLKLQKW